MPTCTPEGETLITTSMKLYKDGVTGSELVSASDVIGKVGEVTVPGASLLFPFDVAYADANVPDGGTAIEGPIWDTAAYYEIATPHAAVPFDSAYPVDVDLIAIGYVDPSTAISPGQIDSIPYHDTGIQVIDDPRSVTGYAVASNIHKWGTPYDGTNGCMISKLTQVSQAIAKTMYDDYASMTLPKLLSYGDVHWLTPSPAPADQYRVIYYCNFNIDYGSGTYLWGKWKGYSFKSLAQAQDFAAGKRDPIESWLYNGVVSLIVTVNGIYTIRGGEAYSFDTYEHAKDYYDCLGEHAGDIADRTGIYDDNPLVYRTRTLDNFASAVGDVRMFHVGKIKTIELNPMTMDNIFTYPSDSNPNDRD